MTHHIGILHPGAMGISVAASAKASGNTVYWLPQGRSAQTIERANTQSLTAIDSLTDMAQRCDIILSICPPHAAKQVAQQVADADFHGIYADLNAIAPAQIQALGDILIPRDIDVVDGGIIGGPAWQPGTTLALSGDRAFTVANLFKNGPLETQVLNTQLGTASALKMCYAAYSKGTTALLSGILAMAAHFDVSDALEDQWFRDDEAFPDAVKSRMQRVTQKAWRFEGEMHQIAQTFSAAGLPEGFHLAAAEIYQRMASMNTDEQSLIDTHKDAPSTPSLPELTDIITHLLKQKN